MIDWFVLTFVVCVAFFFGNIVGVWLESKYHDYYLIKGAPGKSHEEASETHENQDQDDC